MSAEGDMGDMEGLENGAGNGADMLLDDSGAGAADDAVSSQLSFIYLHSKSAFCKPNA